MFKETTIWHLGLYKYVHQQWLTGRAGTRERSPGNSGQVMGAVLREKEQWMGREHGRDPLGAVHGGVRNAQWVGEV